MSGRSQGEASAVRSTQSVRNSTASYSEKGALGSTTSYGQRSTRQSQASIGRSQAWTGQNQSQISVASKGAAGGAGVGAGGGAGAAGSGGQVTVIQVGNQLGLEPSSTVCPNCQEKCVTVTKPRIGLLTWLIAGCLCIVGCIPCCLIPFCCDPVHDVDHACPNCKQHIGTHKRL